MTSDSNVSVNVGWNGKGYLVGSLVIWLLAGATYAPVIGYDFIWDDDDYVTENAELRTWSGLGRIWFVPRATPQYYPLVHTTFWVEYQLWGADPSGYHVVNVAIHALSSSLIYLLGVRWGWKGSWLAAVIFAVHPVHVESVAWVTERKNVLSCLFYLLAAGAWFEFDRCRQSPSTDCRTWTWYWTAIACFAAALLSKTVTCTMPAAMLVLVWLRRGKIQVRDIWPTLPLFALGISCGLMTAYLERLHVGAEGLEFDWPLAKRLLVAGRAVWFYLGALLWPYPLIFFYPRWPTPTAEFWPYLYPISAILLLGILAWGHRKIGRAPLAAALFYGGTLFPALGFFNVYPMRYSYVADHFQYLASLGPIALFAAGLSLAPPTLANLIRGIDRTPWQRTFAAAGLVVIAVPLLAALCGLTRERLQDFAGLRVLWERTLAKNPASETAHHNLGVLDYKDGDIEAARERLQHCIDIDPCPEGHHGLALILKRDGKPQDALEHAERAVKLIPAAEFLVLAADLSFELKRYRQAAHYYRRALEREPLSPDQQIRWAESLMHIGQGPEAVALLEGVLKKDENNSKAHYDLGIVWAAVDRIAEAERHFGRVIELSPKEPAGYLRLGELYVDRGRWDDAIRAYERGLKELPDSAELAAGRARAQQR